MNNVWYELKWYFLEKLNWCHPSDRNNKPKKDTLFYTAGYSIQSHGWSLCLAGAVLQYVELFMVL